MSNEQLIVNIEDPKAIFIDGGVDKLIAEINAIVDPLVFNIDTNAGRAECASWAAKVARSKTLLDGAGKELVSGWKQKAKVVDQQRKHLRDSLDETKARVRAPLTAYEEEQEKQRQKRVDLIDQVERLGNTGLGIQGLEPYTAEIIESRLQFVLELAAPDEWFGDLEDKARTVYAVAKQNLEAALIAQQEKERAAAEKEKRRAAEREAAREREIAERVEREKNDALRIASEKAEREKREAVAAERSKVEAEAKIKRKLAEDRIRQEERHKAAEERGVAQQKSEIERRLINDGAKSIVRKQAMRANINGEVLLALKGLGFGDEGAKKVLAAIVGKKIPHVSITY